MQLALGRSGRARVHRHHAVGRAAAQEEGQADRQLEAGPELVGQVEALQPQRAHAHRAVRGVARAQRPAALARAHDLPLVEVEHVAVIVGDAEAAQVAVLVRLRLRRRLGSAGEPAQPRDRLRALAAGDRGVEIQAAVHGDRATRTTSPSRNSGTGSSWRPSESSERPARGRKKLRLHAGAGQRAGAELAPAQRGAAGRAAVAVGQQRALDVGHHERHARHLGGHELLGPGRGLEREPGRLLQHVEHRSRRAPPRPRTRPRPPCPRGRAPPPRAPGARPARASRTRPSTSCSCPPGAGGRCPGARRGTRRCPRATPCRAARARAPPAPAPRPRPGTGRGSAAGSPPRRPGTARP